MGGQIMGSIRTTIMDEIVSFCSAYLVSTLR